MTHRIIRTIQRAPAEKIAELRNAGIGSSLGSIANVMGPESYMDFGIRPINHEHSFIGPAVTVLMSEPDWIVPALALEIAQPGDVVVVAALNQSRFHLWGPGMTRKASARGLAGGVIDGTYSGTQFIRDVNFPLFGRGPGPTFRRGHVPGSINVPVVCGGVAVRPGDVVYGTEDGIVVIPAERLDEVIAAAHFNTERWEEGKKRLRERQPTLQSTGFEDRLAASGLSEHLAAMDLVWED